MKTITLTFPQRLKASNILGQASGPLERIMPLFAILEAVRFAEEEFAQIKISGNGGGLQTYEPPSADFGTKEVTLEDAQAAAFLRELEAYQGYSVMDVGWLVDLRKQLGG